MDKVGWTHLPPEMKNAALCDSQRDELRVIQAACSPQEILTITFNAYIALFQCLAGLLEACNLKASGDLKQKNS